MDVVIVDGTDRYVMLRGCGFVMRIFDTIRFFFYVCSLVDLVVCSWITFFYAGITGM
jgi:hypothetical protein